ncbi:MAG: class 1 fructose-bisphosphatase [Myxococcales bacterium]|nr:class 1 fructose-bisphosphatase [Myxococcales bacterium]
MSRTGLPSLAADFGVTLTQHVLQNQAQHPGARGQFSALLTQIGVASKLISAQVRRAGLIEIWGATGETNVQGEKVQKLDRIANDTFVEVLRRSGCVAVMASEEEDEHIVVEPELAGDYVVAFDPLDGSSNIDVSVSIGTIFAIYPRLDAREASVADILRPGREMVGAGYVIYGSATTLVYSAGETVDSFTLDPSSGEFFLTRRAIQMPDRTKYLSINECNESYWPAWVTPTLAAIKGRNDHEKRRVSSRHIGSLVADFHRNLLTGGLYLYPVDSRTGKGKLRLLYECNPLAFLAEVAGGAASSGREAILDLAPTTLHERTGLIIGPTADVALAEEMVRVHGDALG